MILKRVCFEGLLDLEFLYYSVEKSILLLDSSSFCLTESQAHCPSTSAHTELPFYSTLR